jgi:hypothetical protein
MGMDVYGRNDSGYFRANVWGWRPIHAISDMAIDKHALSLSTDGWSYNDGHGLETKQECNILADAIEDMIKQFEDGDDDVIYLCLGMWCTHDGQFLSSEETKELNEKYPPNTILNSAVVTSKGTLAEPSHSTSVERLNEWVSFLRECDGFQIF